MTRIGVGRLLKDFEIVTPKDLYNHTPKMRHDFISRLQNELNFHAEKALSDLDKDRGLKLHFQVEDKGDNDLGNIPSEVFLRKMAFYANKTFVSFPFTDFAWSNMGPILHLLCRTSEFLDCGIFNIIPTRESDSKKMVYSNLEKHGLISANFGLLELNNQFKEYGFKNIKNKMTSIPSLLLPYFTNIDSTKVIEIRSEEKEAYDNFQIKLSGLLNSLDKVKSEQILLEKMKEIDMGVRDLVNKYKIIQMAEKKKNVFMLIGFVSIGLSMLIEDKDLRSSLQLILGGPTAYEYFKTRNDYETHSNDLKGDQFYLMWRLTKSKSLIEKIKSKIKT